MNRIYSLVWNRARNQVEVASELARSRRGSAATGTAAAPEHPPRHRLYAGVARALLALPACLALAALGTTQAHADYVDGGGQISNSGPCTPTGGYLAFAGIAIGDGTSGTATACQFGAVAIGSKAMAATAVSVAIGYNTYAAGQAVAIGANATVTPYPAGSPVELGGATGVAIGTGSQATTNQSDVLGHGASATALGGKTKALADGALAAGEGAQAGSGNATDYYDTALGSYSKALGTGATAVGGGAQATADGAIAIGGATSTGAATLSGNAAATDTFAIAIGSNSNATANGAVALGRDAEADDANAVALGTGSVTAAANPTSGVTIGGVTYTFAGTNPQSVVSMGAPGSERQVTNVAAGQLSATSTDAVNGSQLYATNQAIAALAATGDIHDFSVNSVDSTSDTNYDNSGASGDNALAAGVSATAAGNHASALGESATAAGDYSTALGSGAGAADIGSVAVGVSSVAAGAYGTAIGALANAQTSGGTAIGVKAKAGNKFATAIGAGAYAWTDAVAAGYDAVANGSDSVAVGSGSYAYIHALAIGAGSNAKGYAATAFGYEASAMGMNSAALGYGALAKGGAAAAVGPQASATGDYATAVGFGAYAAGYSSTALGDTANAKGTRDVAIGPVSSTYAGGTGANVAIGAEAYAGSATGSDTALGNGASAAGGYSTALGAYAATTGDSSTALGRSASAVGDRSVALGAYAAANNAFDVALGAGSVTAAANPTTGAIIGGVGYVFAGSNPQSVVSVGAPGAERQVTNVAAGRLSAGSTDAVNGSQLYATNQAIDAVGTLASAGWNLSANGGTPVNIVPGGTVDVAQGSNIVVTQDATTGNLTIATTDTPDFTSVTTGDTVMDDSGVAVGGGANGTVSLTGSGLDNGGNRAVNVAAGQLSATSTDAVNGSQLYATNQAVTTNIGDISDLQNQIDNINHSGGGAFLTSTDTTGSPAASGTNSAAGGANASASGDGSLAVGNDSAASGDQSTALGNGAQATGDNSVALGTGSVADADDTVSVGSQGNERRITNVAAGTAPTDAVNVSQLQASQKGGVQYDSNKDGSPNYASVTLNPGGDTPTVIHNVASGVTDNDAVNVGQLNSSIAGAVNTANLYTDQRFNALTGNINQVGNRANAGIASAIAAASLPQPYAPNQSSLGVGLGSFRGEAGIAVGLSTITESGRWILKANVSSDTRGDVGAGVGAGIVW